MTESIMGAEGGRPDGEVLRWAAAAAGGATLAAVESLHQGDHRGSGTFGLTFRRPGPGALRLILRVPVVGWISTRMVITNARALRVAEASGLSAPRLVADDLDGATAGSPATLETWLTGSSAPPARASAAWLEEAGAAIARVHAIPFTPTAALPYRPRPCAVDDRADERRRGSMPTTPLLHLADDRVRAHPITPGESVLLHGDVWPGNTLWDGDRCVALIDWKSAGAGDPGVDLGSLRLQLALLYGEQAPARVLAGWQREAGRVAAEVPYWDAVAALNTPTTLDGWPGFAADGGALAASAVTARRDAFLRSALDALPTRS